MQAAGDENPGRGWLAGQKGGVRQRLPGGGVALRRLAVQGLNTAAWAVQHRHGHQAHDLVPVAPAGQLRQIIGPHQPDKLHPRPAALQGGQRIPGISGAQAPFDGADQDARMSGCGVGGFQTIRERGHALYRL